MKYLIVITSIVLSLNGFGQAEDQNFTLSESTIIWQKVYETEKTKDELINYFKESGLFWTTETKGDQLIGKLKHQKIDPDKTGVAGVPPIVNKTDYKALVIIDLKEKKYRVTMQNIVLIGDGEVLKKGEEQSFETTYLNKELTAYRPFFLKKPSEVYNITFNTLFEIEVKAKDEW